MFQVESESVGIILALGCHHKVVYVHHDYDLLPALADLVEHVSVIGVFDKLS
jgi:hypothetical protein